MKLKMHFILLTQLTMILFASICHAEDHYIVKTSNFTKEGEYKAMSKTDYNRLIADIKKEDSKFSKAHKLAEIEWNKQTDAGRYPGRGLSNRKASKYKTYKTLQEAEEGVLKKKEGIEKSNQKRIEREKKSKKNKRRGKNRNNKSSDRSRQKREENATKRQNSLIAANEFFTKELNTLLNISNEGPDTKPAKKAAKNKH